MPDSVHAFHLQYLKYSCVLSSDYRLQHNRIRVCQFRVQASMLYTIASCACIIYATADFLAKIFVGCKTPPNILTLFRKGVLSHLSVKISLWVVSGCWLQDAYERCRILFKNCYYQWAARAVRGLFIRYGNWLSGDLLVQIKRDLVSLVNRETLDLTPDIQLNLETMY